MTRRSLGHWSRAFPRRTVAALLICWGVIELVVWLMHTTGRWDALDAAWHRWMLLTFLLSITACLAGLFRAVYFHPGHHPGYRQWLARSAWTADRPLPFGPVLLTPVDMFLPALLVALAMFNSEPPHFPITVNPLWPALVFLVMYNAVLWLSLKSWRDRFACLVLLPLSIYPWLSVPVALAVQLAIYLVVATSFTCELRRFPWDGPEWSQPVQARHLAEARRNGLIGWPFNMLGPGVDLPGVSAQAAAAWSGLVAWWMLAVLLAVDRLSDQEPIIALAAQVVGADDPMDQSPLWVLAYLMVALVRLGRYRPFHYLPAMGLRTRLRTGRLIDPGFDRIFVGPLLVVLVGWWSPWLMASAGLPQMLIPPAATFAVLMVALTTGPSLEAWHYTGHHRLWRQTCEPPPQVERRRKRQGDVQISLGRL